MAKRTKPAVKDDAFFLTVKKGKFEALKDGLPKLKEKQIRLMATYWLGAQEAMILPRNELLPSLKKAMSRKGRLGYVLDRLPKRCSDLLLYVLSESGELTMAELRSDFPLTEGEKLQDMLQPLIHRGLVWELRATATDASGARLVLLENCASALQLPSFLEGKIGSVLPSRTREQHYALVRRFKGEVKKLARGNEMVPWLKEQLRNPARLRRVYEGFDVNDRKLLKVLSLHPEGLSAEDLAHEYSLFSTGDVKKQISGILDHLSKTLGLVDVRRDGAEARSRRPNETYRLPREVAHIIRYNFREKYRDSLPSIVIFEPPDEDFALSARGKERFTLWVDFQQLLNHLIRCEVGVIRKGGMHKKNLKRILDRLEGHPVDSYHYLDFLFLYAYERKILYPEGERWKINIEALLPYQEDTAFYRDFWAFYRDNASWNDRDTSPLQGVLQKGDSEHVFSLRRALLRLLWDCPVGQWIEMKVFSDHLFDREAAFHSGELPIATNDPVREKYRFMKSTLERSLAWIGIVDTTTIQSQRLDLFRLTELGAWLMGYKTDLDPFAGRERAETISVQPSFEVLVSTGYLLEKQLYLARFTDDQKGRIVVTRGSIRRGLQEGLTVEDMKGFLQKESRGAVPSNVLNLIEEIGEKAASVFVGGEPVRLEVNDRALMDELLQRKPITSYVQERSDARRALLRRDANLKELMEELRRAGYSPQSL